MPATTAFLTRSAPFGAAHAMLPLPFDAMRQHYAWAVFAGVVPRSILASARVEQWFGALESQLLGPFARCR